MVNKKTLSEQAREAMHHIPYMPEHSEAEHLNNRSRLQNHRLQNNGRQSIKINHPACKPKVLVGWQGKAAKFFGAEIK